MLTTVAMVLSGCLSPNWRITGQVDLVQTDRYGDATSQYDAEHEDRIFITKGDTISIQLSSVYVHQSKGIGGREFLVYAEIYDKQPDDREQLVKVLFKESNQADGFVLNMSERLMFGPIVFTGRPIRIRLFVIELDKEENEITAEIIKQSARVAAAFQPSLAPFTGLATTMGDLFSTLNQDDIELQFDMTLYPHTHSAGPHLRTGSIALIKTENPRRPTRFTSALGGLLTKSMKEDLLNRPESWTPASDREMRDEFGRPVSRQVEDFAELFMYDHAAVGHPLRSSRDVYAWNVLRVMGGRLWLQTVAFELLSDAEEKNRRFGLSDERMGSSEQHRPTNVRFREYKMGGVDFQELIMPTGEKYRLGQRTLYREKTHAVITFSRGGEPVERSLFEELSLADRETLNQALQPAVTSERINEILGRLGDELVKVAEHRRTVRQANAKVGRTNRLTGGFPAAFLKQLATVAGVPQLGVVFDTLGSSEKARNESILEVVGSMVEGFPYTGADAANPEVIDLLRNLTEEYFAPNRSALAPGGDGTFQFVPATSPLRIVPLNPTINIRSQSPEKFQVLRFDESIGGYKAASASEFFFALQGQGPATSGAHSTIARNEGTASVSEAGAFSCNYTRVPQTWDVLRVYPRNDLSTFTETTIAFTGACRFQDQVTIADATNSSGKNVVLTPGAVAQAEWLKRGAEIKLSATVEGVDGSPLRGAHAEVRWEVVEPASRRGPISGSTLVLPNPEPSPKVPFKVVLRAVSAIDRTVTREVHILVAP